MEVFVTMQIYILEIIVDRIEVTQFNLPLVVGNI